MRNKIITKSKILQVAKEIIKNNSVEKCSIRTLSRELDVAPSTIYNYFESREALLEDVFVSSWNETGDKLIVKYNEDISNEQKIRAYIQIIQKDIISRNGLGTNLYNSFKNVDVRNTISDIAFKNVVKAIRDTLYDTGNYSDDISLDMVTELLLFGFVHINSKGYSSDMFLEAVINRFIKR